MSLISKLNAEKVMFNFIVQKKFDVMIGMKTHFELYYNLLYFSKYWFPLSAGFLFNINVPPYTQPIGHYYTKLWYSIKPLAITCRNDIQNLAKVI